MLVLFFRVIILYFLTLFSIRLMGKREIGQLQPFDLIVSMMIAELATQPLEDVNVPLMSGILPVFVLLFLQLFVSYLSYKSKRFRRIINGQSVFLSVKGKINQEYLKKMLISNDELMSILRQQNITDINDLDSLIIETNGQSVVTKKKDGVAMINIIENGEILRDNIDIINISESEILENMKNKGIHNINDVFLGVYCNKKYYFIKKES